MITYSSTSPSDVCIASDTIPVFKESFGLAEEDFLEHNFSHVIPCSRHQVSNLSETRACSVSWLEKKTTTSSDIFPVFSPPLKVGGGYRKIGYMCSMLR